MATLKQQMAAKKAAKAERKLREQAKAVIGAGYAQTPQDKAMLARHRRSQLNKLRQGAGIPPERQLNLSLRDNIHFDSLLRGHNTADVIHFEDVLRLALVLSGLYDDNSLYITAKTAEKALAESADTLAERRREKLRPIARLIGVMDAARARVSAAAATTAGVYCAAAQIIMYGGEYASLPLWQQDAVYRIIRGDSLRQITAEAKSSGNAVSEPAMRTLILDAAWLIYRAAGDIAELPEPDGIPVLRNKAWQPFGQPEHLQKLILMAKNDFQIPFEYNYGISLFNYERFREQMVQATLANRKN